MARKDKLRCTPCYRNAWSKISRGDETITWRNVVVTSKINDDYYNCECKTCGHTYKSRSRAAARFLRNLTINPQHHEQ